MAKRSKDTYAKLMPVIEEAVYAGIPVRFIAEGLGLNAGTLATRMYEWGLCEVRDLRHKDKMAELAKKHGLADAS